MSLVRRKKERVIIRLITFFIAVFCLFNLCGCSKGEGLNEDILTQEEIQIYTQEFNEAKGNGDYVGMNNAMKALGKNDFDYTHGGVVTSYEYSCIDDENNPVEGFVYILKVRATKEDERESIAMVQSVGENDHIVFDFRYYTDPCMQVRNSSEIYDENVMESILDILLEHEEKDPTKWERSKKSMQNEWFIHNIAYEFDYMTERAMHVDLNNNDELIYLQN